MSKGFQSIMALSEEKDDMEHACKPFDAKRSGFVMGEGGGMLVVESENHAKKRGAKLYGGCFAPGCRARRTTCFRRSRAAAAWPSPCSTRLTTRSMSPGDIDYINAHGTSTGYNDVYETQAIKTVFGAAAASIPVSSTKPQTGHCLAGAAGVEAVISVLALCENMVPATLNLRTPDPQCDLDYVPNRCRAKQLDAVMSNSFAFGGHNGVCVFARL